MRLTLKVVRAPDALLPEPRRVNESELSIGRGQENDWVLPDPDRHLSKRHCTLAMRAGRWSVTDHSMNGTFVNRDIQPIGDGQTRNLRDGDRIRVGLYEIEVRIADEETLHGRDNAWITQAGIDTPNNDPFGNDPFGNDPFGATTPDMASIDDSGTGKGRVRPIAAPLALDATLPQDIEIDPRLARPPVVAVPPATPNPPRLPEPSRLPEPPRLPEPAPGPASVPARWDAALSHPLETVHFAPSPAEAPADPPAGEDLLAAFLRGAGIEAARPADPVAIMEALGATFNALVVGLREVMITRARIKSEFRIEQTLMRSQGNNPLKFSADDQDALAALLGIGRKTDMKPADVVASALRDIHTHETAAIAGMRAGMTAILARIEPTRIAAVAEAAPAAGLSPEGKVRAWDMFTHLHADIAASAPDDFEGIFGRAFARGYEQSLRDLN